MSETNWKAIECQDKVRLNQGELQVMVLKQNQQSTQMLSCPKQDW